MSLFFVDFFFFNSSCLISVDLVITVIVFYDVLIFLFTWKPMKHWIVGFIYYWYIQSNMFQVSLLLFSINRTINKNKTLIYFFITTNYAYTVLSDVKLLLKHQETDINFMSDPLDLW